MKWKTTRCVTHNWKLKHWYLKAQTEESTWRKRTFVWRSFKVENSNKFL